MFVNPKFHPVLGDFVEIRDDYESQGKFVAHYFRDVALKGFPYLYFNSGRFDQIWISDPKVMAEFSSLVPSHFDRKAIDNSGFGRVGGTGGVSLLATSGSFVAPVSSKALASITLQDFCQS